MREDTAAENIRPSHDQCARLRKHGQANSLLQSR